MRRVAIWLAAMVVAVSACGSPAPPGDQMKVVASTDVWGSVVNAVGGDHVQVRAIINNPAEDPHSYDASPADVAAITDAQLVVYNGGDYDHFVDQVLDEHAGVQRVNAFTVGGHQAGSNPHVFYVLDTVSAVANAIAEKLAAIDTTHAADYRANAQKFKAQLQDLAGNERAIGAAHPGTSAIATEDIAEYLETATGITDKTPAGYYKAIDADADPAPADIATMLDLVNSRGVQVVLYNPQTDTPVTHRIVDAAKAAGVPVVEVRETLPAGTDFLTWQRQTVDRLSAALKQGDNHSP
jgi:zinc/manganese transport system substrate-binding protein